MVTETRKKYCSKHLLGILKCFVIIERIECKKMHIITHIDNVG